MAITSQECANHAMDLPRAGVAEILSKAKNTSVTSLAEAHISKANRGKVRLLRREELTAGWDPASDPSLTGWEVAHLAGNLPPRARRWGAAPCSGRRAGYGVIADV